MLDSQLFDETRREDTRGESPSKDGRELGVESSDSHILKLEVRSEDRVGRRSSRVSRVSCAPYPHTQERTENN